MKGGFKLIETRSIDDNINIDIIEDECKITFPPYYKLFLKTFYLGENRIKQEEYLKGEDLLPCSFYIYKPMEYIGFENFLSIELSMNFYNDLDKNSYEKINGFFPIAATGTSGILYVGYADDVKDQIYFEYESNWTKVCENIFEFVRGLYYWTREDDLSLKQNVPFSKMFKNWGEHFWRVRND